MQQVANQKASVKEDDTHNTYEPSMSQGQKALATDIAGSSGIETVQNFVST